ncbi:XRE family transcriptional regulator [Dietzia cinnamea]|uniref:XRE family transcriptional regulator n=1 Tax=Dietzia TaxID=37914 RepID=UPI003137E89A
MKAPLLVELIDAHKRAYGVGEAELARRIGRTRQNLHLWRTHSLRGMPARPTLDRMATELRLPYARVLEAALSEAEYLDATNHVVATEKGA